MYTKEQLLTASPRTQALVKIGVFTDHNGKILTKEEAQQQIENSGRLVCMCARFREETVVFFTTDHCFGGNVLPKEWVIVSNYFPDQVVPREGLEDGKITNLEQLLFVFYNDARVIESIDELVEYLNQQERTKHITEVLGTVIADDLKKDMTQNQSSLVKQLGRIMPVRAVGESERVQDLDYYTDKHGMKRSLPSLHFLDVEFEQECYDKFKQIFNVEKHHKTFAEYADKTKTKAVIEYPSDTQNIIGKKYLVRGIGKRAIIVHLHHFLVEKTFMSDFDIVLKAAQVAAQKGWKTVYVDPDDSEGEYAEAFNDSTHWEWLRGYRSNGIDLGLVGFNDSVDSHPEF